MFWSYLLLLILTVSACSPKEKKQEKNDEVELSGIYYQIHENAISDPDEKLLLECSDKGFVRELDIMLADDTVYRIAQVWDIIDEIEQNTAFYLKILKPPYTSWDTQLVSSYVWDSSLEYEGFQYTIWELFDVCEDEVLCIVNHYDEEQNRKQYLGYYHMNGKGELREEIPLEENFQLFASKDGNLYAASKETQMRYAENDTKVKKINSITYSSSFAIRKDALERQIELKKQEKPIENLALMDGVYYQHKGLSEEREEVLQFLLSHAEPGAWNIEAVMDIVSEELEPFFAGQCSAEEAAKKLDNRVQLYLDEN